MQELNEKFVSYSRLIGCMCCIYLVMVIRLLTLLPLLLHRLVEVLILWKPKCIACRLDLCNECLVTAMIPPRTELLRSGRGR